MKNSNHLGTVFNSIAIIIISISNFIFFNYYFLDLKNKAVTTSEDCYILVIGDTWKEFTVNGVIDKNYKYKDIGLSCKNPPLTSQNLSNVISMCHDIEGCPSIFKRSVNEGIVVNIGTSTGTCEEKALKGYAIYCLKAGETLPITLEIKTIGFWDDTGHHWVREFMPIIN